jgi:hypothetical protein
MDKSSDFIAVTQALATLRGLGWEIIAFSPDCVAGVDRKVLETASVEAYWGFLEDIGKDVDEAKKLA